MLAEPYINNSEVPLHSPGQLRRVTFSDSHHVSQYEQPACSGDDSELGLSLLGDTQQVLQHKGWWQMFKAQVKALKREVLALYYAVHDPRTSWVAKLLPILCCLMLSAHLI
eukprot:jgi/Chrzof1/13275/Cz07g27060.t1